MFSEFFIARPKFAIVVSIVMCLAGLLALGALPVNMYPQIAPPQVQVSAVYPGASALVVEEAILRPLEEAINGVEGMDYLSSSASNSGSASITVTFEGGYDPDLAQINVQNRVSAAQAKLPQDVLAHGVQVTKQSSTMLLGINLISQNNQFDNLFLSNYAANHITESLSRVQGVASTRILGERKYSMRIWLNPNRMSALQVTVSDVSTALREQNVIIAAGKIGQSPSLPDQQFEYSIKTNGRLSSPEQFEDMIIRADKSGSFVRLRDIARVEMGAENYDRMAIVDDQPTVFIAAYQLSDANALDTAKAIKAQMAELAKDFPDGLTYAIHYDTTTFIERSIDEVISTLWQAVVLVVLVVFLFLQNWRATLIPAITIPVSLVTSFAALHFMGYSINTITLFGLVLAIGIVVDDAIVVIENVERLISKEGLEPLAATKQAMREVSSPIISTTLVLLAVFIPVSFMPGTTGKIYQQFSITIVVAVVISSINALTLSPALCALLLKKDNLKHVAFLRPIERGIEKLTGAYGDAMGTILRRGTLVCTLFSIAILSTGWIASKTPSDFIPNEDQGLIILNAQLPDAASLNRTTEAMQDLSDIIMADPDVAHFVRIAGFSIMSGISSNSGFGVIILRDWAERTDPASQFNTVIGRLQGKLWAYPEASAMIFPAPAIPGLSGNGGFEFQVQDKLGHSPQELSQVVNGLIFQANQNPALQRVFTTYRANVPQYLLEVNRDKAKALGISLNDIFDSLQAQLGSLYINDFSKFNRTYQVVIQAEAEFRSDADDLQHMYVRNIRQEMVPLSTLAQLIPTLGPISLEHFNMFRSAKVSGQASPGFSSGAGIEAMEQLAANLPEGYGFEWSGQAAQQIQSDAITKMIFAIALIFVYLFLVAQYESWSLPFVVMSSVPLALLGAYLGINSISEINNNVYAQVGLILLMGLSAKTAILIVEFAIQQRKDGATIFQSALTAAKLRYRPVLMTALSFVLGVLPLVFSSGPGAMSRISVGITVLGGMLITTILAPLLVPWFYLAVQSLRERFHQFFDRNKTG